MLNEKICIRFQNKQSVILTHCHVISWCLILRGKMDTDKVPHRVAKRASIYWLWDQNVSSSRILHNSSALFNVPSVFNHVSVQPIHDVAQSYLNSWRPTDTTWRHRSWSIAVHVPNETKPLPEPMLTYHQWDLVAFAWGQFHSKCYRYLSLIGFETLLI